MIWNVEDMFFENDIIHAWCFLSVNASFARPKTERDASIAESWYEKLYLLMIGQELFADGDISSEIDASL